VISFFNKEARLKSKLSRISLIACDLDGTLLDNENKISPEILELADSLKETGVQIVLASGRPAAFTQMYAECIGSDMPVISVNGGLITASGDQQGLYCSPLPSGVFEQIELFQQNQHSPLECTAFAAAGLLTTHTEPNLPKYLRSELNTYIEVDSLSGREGETGLSVVYGTFPSLQLLSVQLAKEYKSLLRRVHYPSKTAPEYSYLEIMHSRTTKGEALAFLCKKLGIRRNQVAAIGDYANDLEMLRFAGFAGAMGNAIDEVIKDADFVTTKSNIEGGISEFFRFILEATSTD